MLLLGIQFLLTGLHSYLQYLLIFSKVLLFLSFSSNPLLKTSPNGEYSNLAFSTTPGLYPISSLVKCSYLSNSPDDNAEILAAPLSKFY